MDRNGAFLAVCVTATAAAAATPEVRQGDHLAQFVWDAADSLFCADDLLPLFRAEEIADCTMERMLGRSYPAGCPVRRSDLRYLIIPHYDGHGHVRLGEMVCNRAIADDLVAVFRELFRVGYPVERMVLIDEFDADDQASMAANNTSCFNYRTVAGSSRLSRHALGMAIDINPLYNPYVRSVGSRRIIMPQAGKAYVDRTRSDIPYKITLRDAAYKLFRQHGFKWGGSWRTRKDYQHFQK